MSRLAHIREKAEHFLGKTDALSLRERVLVTITLLAMITALWHVLLMAPLSRRADASRAALAATEQRITAANRSLEEQVLQLAGGGDEQQARITMIRLRIDEINETLSNYTAELIDPAEMARVLEGVLREQSRLTLRRIRNLPPESFATSESSDATTFYRHGLEIEFEGSFAACLEYLHEIESLPWRLYWQLLDLEVIEYPRNRIRIEVSTLSLDREWIGA